MSKVTCVGCGMMGSNIVESFMNGGHAVCIVDLNKQSALKYIEKGALYSTSINDALDCDFIVLSLPNDNVVLKVFENVDSLSGKIVVNTSSEVPSEVINMQKFFTQLGAKYLDATILTYQGEVGTKYGKLLYSGDENVFKSIEKDLECLSKPAVYVGESIVGSEIVDLVAITAHFGITYTPLENMCLLDKYGIDVDKYLNDLDDVLSLMSNTKPAEYNKLEHLDYEKLVSFVDKKIKEERVFDKLNDKWLDDINKSLSNHYRKIINIKKTDYEY